MRPYSPIPRIVAGDDHRLLIHRVLRPDVPPCTQRIDLVTTSQKRISVVDSGAAPRIQIAEGDTAVHILWQQQESDATIWMDEMEFPIAPGDSAMIPGGDSWRLAPDTLAILIAVRQRNLALPIAPTHGEYHFEGFNRESRYPTSASFGLSRWKITQELTLPAIETERVIVSLYNDVAVQYDGGVTMIHQGHASVIRSQQITLVPNGLSYVMFID